MAGVEDMITGPKPLVPVAFLPSVSSGDDWTVESELGQVQQSKIERQVSGTYTAVLVNVSGLQSYSGGVFQYMQVGQIVSVSGDLDNVLSTAALQLVQFGIPLPIPSNFTTGFECAGGGAREGNVRSADMPVKISADTTNNRAQAEFWAVDTIATNVTFFFMYLIV